MRMLSAGFIVTSLLWAGMTAALVDRRLRQAGAWAAAAALFTLFGIIHSPYGDGRLFLPWNLAPLAEAATGRGPIEMALAYGLLADHCRRPPSAPWHWRWPSCSLASSPPD